MEFVSFFITMLLSLLLSLSISSCYAFNITELLEEEENFSIFNQKLTETKLADQINKRSTITVLAVDNAAIGGLDKDPLVAKAIMSVHVILDYYDKEKLTSLARRNRSATLTTLYQTSGLADSQQGFVRISADSNGEITFASAASNRAPQTSNNAVKMIRPVTSQPYNISVIQVSSVIQVPYVNAEPSYPASAPASIPAPAPRSRKMNPPSPSYDDDVSDEEEEEDEVEGDDIAPSTDEDRTPPKPDEIDEEDSPSMSPAAPKPAGKSGARATAAEMGVGVVAMGLVSVLVGLF